MASAGWVVGGRSSSSGLTFVRRKWSGQDVPSAASLGCSVRARKSRTAGESSKCPTWGRSWEARARMWGARAAARSRRSASGSAPYPSMTGPNGSAFPCSARNVSAVRMMRSALASHSSEVSPQAVMPWPPRTQPIACGVASLTAAMSRPSWKPGRRQGTQATVSPKQSAVSFSPSAAQASEMPESGCRWSTCGASTSPCMAVSMEGAAPPLPCRQWSNAATISSSRSTPG
ncbi:hypothetical protein SMICM17S_11504 [Streptomyces microflavus]